MNPFFDDEDDLTSDYPGAYNPHAKCLAYSRSLEVQLAEVAAKYTESVDLCVGLVQTNDAMKLQLIMAGALVIPEKLEKPEEFKQENPRDQFTAIVGGLEGLALNAADGTSTDAVSTGVKILDLLERLKKLSPYLKKEW